MDLKERWGIFLIENSLNNIERDYKKNKKSITSNNLKDIEKEYEKFEKELTDYYYGFDLKINEIVNIIVCGSFNKKEYEFLNGLYLNKSDNIDIINKGISLYPELCLGGYMFKIINNIEILQYFSKFEPIQRYGFNCKKTLSDIKNTFSTLIQNINLLIKQFEYYQTIIGNLGYNHEDFEICIQNKQKLKLMIEIRKLMEKNNEEVIKNENNFFREKLVKKINLKSFIKRRKLNINKLVIEYFREYGICLFELTDKPNSKDDFCLIC